MTIFEIVVAASFAIVFACGFTVGFNLVKGHYEELEAEADEVKRWREMVKRNDELFELSLYGNPMVH